VQISLESPYRERPVLAVSCPSYCRFCHRIYVRFGANLTFAEKVSSVRLGQAAVRAYKEAILRPLPKLKKAGPIGTGIFILANALTRLRVNLPGRFELPAYCHSAALDHLSSDVRTAALDFRKPVSQKSQKKLFWLDKDR